MTAHEGGDVPRGMAVIDVILGGLPCRLVLPEVVAAPLRERYRGYEHAVAPVLRCTSRVEPGFAVAVEDVEYPAAVATCVGTVYRIQRRDLDATLDVASGELQVTSRPAHYVVESALRVAVSLLLPRRDGLLLHSSGVVEAGLGHVFSGRSGAGKTTTVRLLAPRPPLGDDLVALLPDGDGFRAFATPFAGEYGPVSPRSAPLTRLYFLEQAEEHRLLSLDAAAARTRLLQNTLAYVRDADTALRLQDVTARIAARVPCVRMRFRRDAGAAALLSASPTAT